MITIEYINGDKWVYEYAPLNKYLAVTYKTKAWHLFEQSTHTENYHGNFATKKAMYEYIKIHNTGGV